MLLETRRTQIPSSPPAPPLIHQEVFNGSHLTPLCIYCIVSDVHLVPFGVRRSAFDLNRKVFSLRPVPASPPLHSAGKWTDVLCLVLHFSNAQTKNIHSCVLEWRPVKTCVGFPSVRADIFPLPVLGFVLQWALECFQHIDEMTSYH